MRRKYYNKNWKSCKCDCCGHALKSARQMKYCSKDCQIQGQRRGGRATNKVKCIECKKEFYKTISEINKTENHFCSRNCSAKHNNKKFPRRKRKRVKCKGCDVDLTYLNNQEGRKLVRTYCDKCNDERKFENRTLEDLLKSNSRVEYAYGRIREKARSLYGNRKKKCQSCGYDRHLELCHIKAISSFDIKTKVKIINDPKNLLYLCRNCHWELDNGHLVISKLNTIKDLDMGDKLKK